MLLSSHSATVLSAAALFQTAEHGALSVATHTRENTSTLIRRTHLTRRITSLDQRCSFRVSFLVFWVFFALSCTSSALGSKSSSESSVSLSAPCDKFGSAALAFALALAFAPPRRLPVTPLPLPISLRVFGLSREPPDRKLNFDSNTPSLQSDHCPGKCCRLKCADPLLCGALAFCSQVRVHRALRERWSRPCRVLSRQRRR